MKKALILFLFLALLTSSCETMDHWLFNASDYQLIPSKTDSDESSIYWYDWDYEFWEDELEYE